MDKKIAAGSFGTLFLGRHISTKKTVAIKAERKDCSYPQLHREYKFYQILAGATGIPTVYSFVEAPQQSKDKYHTMVMDLLGPTVEDVLQACGGSFSLKTTCMVSMQLLDRLEFIHSKGLLYRDVKSENFLLGQYKQPNHKFVHIIDFGLSKEYINPITKEHVPFNVKKGSVGTPRYMSIHALQHHEQGRRDDLEAMSYLFLYLYAGRLPWQGLPGSTFAEKCKRILEKKLKLTVDEVCEDAPTEFARFMKYARSLEFEEKPDYDYCRQLFGGLMKKNDLEYDDIYDWTDSIPAFWKSKSKLVDSLPALPDDLSARVRAAERDQVPFALKDPEANVTRRSKAISKKEPVVESDGSGCCSCCGCGQGKRKRKLSKVE